MSRRVNTKIIGAFVVSALALIVAAVIVFGGGRFLKERKKLILFFSGSVKGLSIGAPVDFRGVRVGSVVDVNLVLDLSDLSFSIPVVIEIETDRVTTVLADKQQPRTPVARDKFMEMLIQKGLRAQLGIQSFLTGQLYVYLDLHPDTPINLSGVKSDYDELPTIPSQLEQLTQKLEQIPLEEMINSFKLSLQGIERFINSPELGQTETALKNALVSVDKLAQNLDKQVKPVSSNFQDTAAHARKLIVDVDSQIKPIAGDVREVVKSLRELVKNSEQTLTPLLTNANSMVEEGSPMRYSITKTLEDLAAAARSLRTLADTLERHPEEIIRGKKGEK